jgi:hypothetical protein
VTNTNHTPLAAIILEAVDAGCDTAQAIRGFMLARGIARDTGTISSCAGYLRDEGKIRIEGTRAGSGRKYLGKANEC